MEIIQVDGFDTQPCQGLFYRRPNIIRLSIWSICGKSELGGKKNFVSFASAFEPLMN